MKSIWFPGKRNKETIRHAVGSLLLWLVLFFPVTSYSDAGIIYDSATVFRPVKTRIDVPSRKVEPGETIDFDDPAHPEGPFFGVYLVQFNLDKTQFYGNPVVDFYVKKGSDPWKKTAELDPGARPNSGDWIVRHLWNPRLAAFEWNATQPFADNLQIRLIVRNPQYNQSNP
jgi:hypothetical protein